MWKESPWKVIAMESVAYKLAPAHLDRQAV
jgi:hypothetical protein